MSIVVTLILTVQMLSALGMIGLILVQHGKGADMGAAFGSGGSGSLFGASGSANFLSRTTAVLAAVFFVCTLALAYFSNLRPDSTGTGSVLDRGAMTAPNPSPTASGVAAQIPAGSIAPGAGASAPTSASAGVPAAAPVQPAASGSGQIPTK
jgi:preprotein translocase subunit SecG